MSEKVGILTGGGDCPGLNAVIRSVVRKATEAYNYKIIGFIAGWRGIMDMQFEPLDRDRVQGIIHRGGTIIKTSRTNPLIEKGGIRKILENFGKLELAGLIAVGGEDTLGVAKALYDEGLPVVGVPKTIDNDLSGTDYTFGYDTAISIATDAIDRVHTTAESHNRVMVVEVMGRHTGWIAIGAGLAGAADLILIPEKPIDIEHICRIIKKRHDHGRDFSVVVVAEGAKFKPGPDGDERVIMLKKDVDEFGHVYLGGIGNVVADEIEKRTGFEARVVILGHVQRGGSPTAFDRVLATRFGVAAIDLVNKGEFGVMTALRGNRIVPIPLAEAVAGLKYVSEDIYEVAETFFG